MNSSYLEYKTCTVKFVQWIFNAAGSIDKSSKKLANTLGALKTRVRIITDSAVNRASMSDSILGSFSESMLAGYRAIQLRKEIHSFYTLLGNDSAEHRASNETHGHCIRVLKNSYLQLKTWMDEHECVSTSSSSVAASEKPELRTNRFASLEIDDTDNTSEAEISQLSDDLNESKSIDEIDEAIGDLKISALCLLQDMMSAMDQVKKVWEGVRAEEKSILTAVGVTMTAYDHIVRAYSAIQLKYPSLVTADDFYVSCLMENLSDAQCKKFTSHPFIRDQLDIKVALNSMSTAFSNPPTRLIYRRGQLGAPYHEEHDPLKHGMTEYFRFFAVEIANLYNNYLAVGVNLDGNKMNSDKDPNSTKLRFINQPLTNTFYSAFVPHFSSKIVSVSQLFLAHCWTVSIQCLQSAEHRFLGRSLYYLRKLGRRIDASVKAYVDDPRVQAFYDRQKNKQEKDEALKMLQFLSYEHPYGGIMEYAPLHANPILQGCIIWDKLLNYMHLGTQLMQGLSSYHRAICHMYNGLLKEGFLTARIPLLDTFFNVYKQYVFVGGNPVEITKGNYGTQYNLASHCTVLGMANPASPSIHRSSKDLIKPRQRLDPSVLSVTYQILMDKNYQGILEGSALTLSESLQRVEHAIEKELFSSRYLTFLFTHFHLEFYSFFLTIRDHHQMIKDFYQQGYNTALQDETPSYRHTQALEMSVMATCTVSLDQYNPLPGPDDRNFRYVLNELSKLIVKTFGETMVEDEEILLIREWESMQDGFFLFPPSRRWLVQEFGSVTCSKAKSPSVERTAMSKFTDVLDLLEDAEEDVQYIIKKPPSSRSEEEKETLLHTQKELKRKIKEMAKQCPAMLFQLELQATQLKITILDHAISGIWSDNADCDFAEWILQTWGYNFNRLMQHTHLQLAVIHNQMWALDLLLCENSNLYIDFQCPNDGNTALHYAAMQGNDKMMKKLMNSYANTEIRNRAGLRACDIVPRSNKNLAKELRKRGDELHQQRVTKEASFAPEFFPQRLSEFNERTARLTASQEERTRKLREEEKRHIPTAAEIQRASQAEQELLAMLANEEAKGGKGGNNKKTKKKNSKK